MILIKTKSQSSESHGRLIEVFERVKPVRKKNFLNDLIPKIFNNTTLCCHVIKNRAWETQFFINIKHFKK